MTLFLKLADINGDVTTSGFAKDIELTSLQFGFGETLSSSPGGSGRAPGKPSVSDITVTKELDISSVPIMTALLSGKAIASGEIYATQTVKADVVTYETITLTNIFVTGYSQSSGGDRPTESLSFAFDKISITYSAPDGSSKPQTVTYDLTKLQTS